MTYSNGVRIDTQQLRDIQDLIARLADVNRRLSQPLRSGSAPGPADADPADAS